MTSTWVHWQGTSLDEKYELEEFLGESEGSAFFRTSFGADRQPALLKLIAEASSAATDEQLQLWRITAATSHPNLLRLRDYGVAEEEGENFLYAVFEFPDDTLASALKREPLTIEETREVLLAALDGLRCLHGHGLVHAALDASHVVAVGSQIKLSTDSLRLASRGETTAEDVWLLGALVYQMISGQRLAPGVDLDLSSIPEPFRTVIQRSIVHDPNRRWPLAEIAAAVQPSPPKAEAIERPKPTPARSPRAFPKWIYAATPLFLIALLLIFRGIRPQAEAPAQPVAAVAQSPVASRPPVSKNWRVVAFTYARRGQAEKKAESINRKWSGAQAEVLDPSTAKPAKYLVAVGGPMDRQEALRFLKLARSRGMPRTAYVRNETP